MAFETEEERGQSVGREAESLRSALFEEGRDEMNLAEFPLSGIADRFLDGRKTVVFSDQVWDRDRREHLARELSISGSDRYGLPTAKDEDVLLACIQLSSLGEFQKREVHFSRYELLKLLRWPDEGKSYQRLSTALRRWKGVDEPKPGIERECQKSLRAEEAIPTGSIPEGGGVAANEKPTGGSH